MKKFLILILISSILLSLLIIPNLYKYKIASVNETSYRYEIAEGHEESNSTQPTWWLNY
jgi:competence protein ComGC